MNDSSAIDVYAKGQEVNTTVRTRKNFVTTNSYVVQTDATILHITTQQGGRFKEAYQVQLFHRQLVKGIPSFSLSDLESVQLFIAGFLFGDASPAGYEFYCNAMENTYFQYPEFLDLFNVRRQQQKREQGFYQSQITDKR